MNYDVIEIGEEYVISSDLSDRVTVVGKDRRIRLLPYTRRERIGVLRPGAVAVEWVSPDTIKALWVEPPEVRVVSGRAPWDVPGRLRRLANRLGVRR